MSLGIYFSHPHSAKFCIGLILNQALLAGSVKAETALGLPPIPSEIQFKKKRKKSLLQDLKIIPSLQYCWL